MSNISRNLRQICTYWSPGALDSYGKREYNVSQELPCRWEDKAELFIARNGQELTSKSKVFFAFPIEVEGLLYLGEYLTTVPEDIEGTVEIRAVYKIPDLRNLRTLYVGMI